MQLVEMTFRGARPVEGYGPGFFRIDGQVIEGAMIARGDRARGWAGWTDLAALEALAGQVDVVFLGMGAVVAHPDRAARDRLEALGLALEPMTTPTACRTYNVLLAEGRRVALAALPV